MLHRKICLVFLAWVLLSSFPAKAEVILGLPYEKMRTTDAAGHDVVYYVTHPDHPAVLVIFIQDSGCVRLFEKTEDGHYAGEFGVMMKHAAQDRVTLVAVERPHTIPWANIPQDKEKTSVGCPIEYLEQDTLETRLQQIQAALQAAKTLPWVKSGPILVVGRQDGATLAGMLARNDASITDIALVGAEGAPEPWRLITKAIRENNDAASTQTAIEQAEQLISKIKSNGDSINNWFGDYPYKYWASIFRAFPIDDLLHSTARVYVMQAFPTPYLHIISNELIITALQSQGHSVTVHRFDAKTSEPTEENIRYVTNEYARAIDWFLANNGLMPPR